MTNSTIHCIVDMFVKPESVEKMRSVLLKLVEDSCREDGCLTYKLLENINDKSQFTFIEIWENEEAFDNHLQSDHIRKVSVDVKDDLTRIVDIKRYKYIKSNQIKTKDTKFSSFLYNHLI